MKRNELSFSSRVFGLLLTASALGLLLTGTGCGKRISGPAKMVPLTLKSQATGSSMVRALRAASLALADSDSSHVDVTFTRALLVVRDVRFKSSEGDSEGPDNEIENDSLGEAENDSLREADDDSTHSEEGGVVFRGPFVLDLLSHHADVLDTKLVPPGLYQKVQGHLRALQAGDAAATPDLSFLIGSTIYLEGTISGDGGSSFIYKARIDDEFVIHGDFTVQSDTPATAFLVFNLDGLLVDREGRFLDPRDPANDQAIRSAIRHAIKIGEDRNHDGEVDDDGGHTGGDAPPLARF
jgi:hypothetical protein